MLTTAMMRASLDAVERSFSDESQVIGLGPAFAKYGTVDAVNMGGPTDGEFTRGAEAISRAVSGGAGSTPSPVSWAPDRVIVSSSGDLGVTIGVIRQNVARSGSQPGRYSFFTVWRRNSTSEPWRYVAE